MQLTDKGSWKLLNVLGQDQLADLLAALAAGQIESMILRGDAIRDQASLLARAHQDLPHPPGRAVPDGWSALADNLWERLCLSPHGELALLWTDSQVLLDNRLEDLLEAVDALTALSRKLYRPASAGGASKTLYLFLLGTGATYRPGPTQRA